MTELRGDLSSIDKKVLVGWATFTGDETPTVFLTINGAPHGAYPATLVGDPEGVSGVKRYDWRIPISESVKRDAVHDFVLEIRADGAEAVTIQRHVLVEQKPAIAVIDHVRPDHVYGWIKPKGTNSRAMVGLWDGTRLLSRQLACGYRGEVADAGHGDGRFGFSIPLQLRNRLAPSELQLVTIEGDYVRRLDTVFFGRSGIRVLIVTDTKDVNNASRHYRAALHSNVLWKSGAEVVLMDKSEVKPDSFDNFHVVILQRAPANGDIVSAVMRGRVSRSLILYETDDINTLPDLVGQMGSIRSGFRKATDHNFVNELRGRMVSANLADAIITSNNFMEKVYRSHGFRTINAPFRIDEEDIGIRRRQPLDKDNWRLLYMSGSPTHGKDFKVVKEALVRFVNEREDVTLTVLGDVDARDFKGFDRIRFKGRLPYKEMLKTIDEHDCVVAPFERSTFNYGKSCTKFMEAGARGVPVIVSHIPDYVPHVKRSGFGALVREGGDWYAALKAGYDRRVSDYNRSGELCRYVRETFSTTRAGNALFDDILAMYGKAVCLESDPEIVWKELSVA